MPGNSIAPKSPRTETAGGKPMNAWMIISIILAIALVAVVVTLNKGGDPTFKPVSSQDAGKALISFVNEIYGSQIGISTLKTITEKNGMYQATVTVKNAGQDVDQTVYMSKDGKLFIPQALNIADVTTQYRAYQQSQQPGAPTSDTSVTPGATSGTPVLETDTKQ